MNEDPNENEVADTNRVKGLRNIGSIILITLLLLAGLFMVRVVFWAAEEPDVLEVKNAPVPVRSIRPHPQADGVVFLTVDYCKNTDSEGRLRMSFINHTKSREIFLPAATDREPASCALREIAIPIPHDITPDTYYVHFRLEYRLNPFKTVVEEFDSLEFEVVTEQR